MKVKTLLFASLAAVFVLSSCSSTDKNPLPLYLAPETPMDPPGTEMARKAEFDKRQQEGAFAVGDTAYVSQGKAYFFALNPEIDGGNAGKMMNADEVTIVSCEGMYYYVKTLDQDGGYLRESDLVNANARAQLNFDGEAMDGVFFGDPTTMPEMTGGGALFPTTDGLTIAMPVGEDPNARKVVTNAQGRVVTLEKKKTEASTRFEEKTASLPFTTAPEPAPEPSADTPTAPSDFVPSSVNDDDIPDLP